MTKKLDKIPTHKKQTRKLDDYIKYGICDSCGRESYSLFFIDTDNSCQIEVCRRCQPNNKSPTKGN